MFSAPLIFLSWLLGFLTLPYTYQMKIWQKRKQVLFLARFEPTTHQLPSQMHNQINQFVFVIIPINFRISLSHLTFKYINKIMHKLKYTQLAYIRLEPKSAHTSKYSQPFELVLFHVIVPCIKCLKGFYYPHLLNNYLINYLIFLGSYTPPQIHACSSIRKHCISLTKKRKEDLIYVPLKDFTS